MNDIKLKINTHKHSPFQYVFYPALGLRKTKYRDYIEIARSGRCENPKWLASGNSFLKGAQIWIYGIQLDRSTDF